MLRLLQNWKGSVEVDNTIYNSISELSSVDLSNLSDSVNIILHSSVNTSKTSITDATDTLIYKITVKQYMTRKATADFDFMKKWNYDVPMPMRTMIGEVLKETRGMIYMKLHCDILQEVTTTCMCCGKPITNKVSQYFGVGPICGHHDYTNPFDSDKDLKDAVEQYRAQLRNITWEGWIIKSAIEEKEIYND